MMNTKFIILNSSRSSSDDSGESKIPKSWNYPETIRHKDNITYKHLQIASLVHRAAAGYSFLHHLS
jgi:hypothetical protein